MKKHRIRITSGIQRKYLRATIALLLLALLLSGIGVGAYMHVNLTRTVIDTYKFADEKMGLALDALYERTAEVTGECITAEQVQESLRSKELGEAEQTALGKYFSYVDLEHVVDYCYVDNKGNVYTRSYTQVSYRDYVQSGFKERLGEEYAKTKWFYTQDTLFGTGKEALFIGRYVHNMEYAHNPGVLFFKMDDSFLQEIIRNSGDISKESVTGIADEEGNICTSFSSEDEEIAEIVEGALASAEEKEGEGMILSGFRVRGGILSAYRQAEGGFTVFTYVPYSVIDSEMGHILLVMLGIYLFVIAAAVLFSVYFSKRFTQPIQDITETMTGFDGNDFSHTIELHTNTELDEIGHSYNKMLENIRLLLEEVKEQQKELRTSELNMLFSQIKPHFLYNTLDTIYMLARLNKEETAMKMIQALSKYLRLSLSKGNDIVTVEDELENVRNYMEIQQIRNENLFRYEIECTVEAKETWVLKLILQPLVENAVKYGFADIFEGGVIRIGVWKESDYLVLSVYNNGKPMNRDTAEKINGFRELPVTALKESFPDKQHGYGVVNIMTRLRLKYGEQVQFYYEVEEDGTRCIVKIPGGGAEYNER